MSAKYVVFTSNLGDIPASELIDQTGVGQSTATPVNATTLAASGAVTGAGITALFAAPPTIGGSGPVVEAVETIAAAGATQGDAAVIDANAYNVLITATASTEGVSLPATVVAGRKIKIFANSAIGNNVYAGTGAVINANTTATTAYALALDSSATFFAVDATHWRT